MSDPTDLAETKKLNSSIWLIELHLTNLAYRNSKYFPFLSRLTRA